MEFRRVLSRSVRLLFVIDASQPPPAALRVTRLLPVVGHQLTSPAAGVQATPPTLLVTLVLYLTESAKNASSAVTRFRKIGSVHVRTPVTFKSRMPASA